MKRHILSIAIFLFLGQVIWASGSKFTLILPQTAFVPGERVWFGLGNEAGNEATYLELNLYKAGTRLIVEHQYIKVDTLFGTYSFTLHPDISAGSYVLSLSTAAINELAIVSESAQMIHVMSQDPETKYQVFADGVQGQFGDLAISRNITTRQVCEIPGSTGQASISYVVQKNYDTGRSVFYYENPGMKPDTCFRTYLSAKNTQNIFAFFPESRKTQKVSQGENGAISVVLKPGLGDGGFNLIDVLTGEDRNDAVLQSYALPSFNAKLAELDVDSRKTLASLHDSSLKREKLNRIFHSDRYFELHEDDGIAQIKSDNHYEMSEYLEFESLELYLREVVLPVRLRKSKEGRFINVLNGDFKKWLPGEAIIFIDGRLVKDHEVFLKMSWKDLKSIDLFRSIGKLKQYYGALGRNGIVEIKTNDAGAPEVKYANALPLKRINFTQVDIHSTEPELSAIHYFGKPGMPSLIHGDDQGQFTYFEVSDKGQTSPLFSYSVTK